MKLKHFLILLIFSSSSLYSWGLIQGRVRSQIAQERNEYYQEMYLDYNPFYAGPLLAPSAYTVPPGKINIQPYFFWQRNWGEYDRTWHRTRTRSSLQFKFLNVTQIGITHFMELSLVCSAVLNRKQNQHHFGYGDTALQVGLQLLDGIRGSVVPACKLLTGVIFPTGRHEKLTGRKLGIDSTGAGAYGTVFSLNFQKNFNYLFKRHKAPKSYHPFRMRWSFGYSINSRTRVVGINAYGGAPGTHGIVKVGNNFTSILSWEFSFNRYWVFATDWEYTVNGPSRFSGNTGGTPVGKAANQNWSVAPALEFNLNSQFAALVGAWFSFAGRNSNGFVAGVASITYLF